MLVTCRSGGRRRGRVVDGGSARRLAAVAEQRAGCKIIICILSAERLALDWRVVPITASRPSDTANKTMRIGDRRPRRPRPLT
ncbi:hypothetical protein EVAR_295_1 [Eumeta japonica]|uniref:Uncharacterized protein n=1 Tax=Eumeta variegata TaxID=151549 RepID=A0A4C1S9B6_EUMVA|nr:hypothetical protein EVAR_295_1 [Eumeta japonica]